MSALVTSMMVLYLLFSYLLVYRYTILVHRASRVTAVAVRFKWYERVAGTYVLALPIFLLSTYLITRLDL